MTNTTRTPAHCVHCNSPLMPRHFDAVQLHASGYRYCTIRGGIPGTVATLAN